MASWNLQWRSPSNSISFRSPPRAWRNVKLQGLKERRGERDGERVAEAAAEELEKRRMRDVRVKSAGKKTHLRLFYAQAVVQSGLQVEGSTGRSKHVTLRACVYRLLARTNFLFYSQETKYKSSLFFLTQFSSNSFFVFPFCCAAHQPTDKCTGPGLTTSV